MYGSEGAIARSVLGYDASWVGRHLDHQRPRPGDESFAGSKRGPRRRVEAWRLFGDDGERAAMPAPALGDRQDVVFPPRCFSVARTLQPSGHAADNAETRCFMALIERQRASNASCRLAQFELARQASAGLGGPSHPLCRRCSTGMRVNR